MDKYKEIFKKWWFWLIFVIFFILNIISGFEILLINLDAGIVYILTKSGITSLFFGTIIYWIYKIIKKIRRRD